MTQQNTILKKYNGASYDNVYPTTKASDVKCTNPFTQQASNLQDTIDYMVEMKTPYFTLFDGQITERFECPKIMTWAQWVSSPYNTSSTSEITDGNVIGLIGENNLVGWSPGGLSQIRYYIADEDDLVSGASIIQWGKRYEVRGIW